jgi:predicted dehydrogenase
MSANPIRFILVGLGARAQFWMRVLNKSSDCTIVGLVDPNSDARTRAASLCPEATVGRSLNAVASDVDADAVLLCTPPAGREDIFAEVCAKGLAILAEKPLAERLSVATDYVEMAEAAGVMLMVGLNFRYLPVTIATKELFETELGAPEFARFTYERWRDGKLPRLNKYPLEMAQPMLWEQSIHHFDLLRFVYGAEPVHVFARTFNPSWSMYADDANVSAIFAFDNGMTVNYQGTWQGNWSQLGFAWRTECRNGICVQNDQFGDLAYAKRPDPKLTPVSLPDFEHWIDDATALLSAFVAAYRGEAPLECSGRDHLNSLRMVEACILSSSTGNAIIPAEIDRTLERANRPGLGINKRRELQ